MVDKYDMMILRDCNGRNSEYEVFEKNEEVFFSENAECLLV